jgi:uncharacterized protein DUF4245
MLRSLAVVLVVVAAVVWLTARDEPRDPVKVVDYAGSVTQAREVAPYDVLAPAGLDKRWRATSVRVERDGDAVTWHLGFVTPRNSYAGLEQSDGDATKFVEEFATGARPVGQVRLGDLTWQRVEGGKPEPRALLLRGKGVTTVVAGGAPWAELDALARALRGE